MDKFDIITRSADKLLGYRSDKRNIDQQLKFENLSSDSRE